MIHINSELFFSIYNIGSSRNFFDENSTPFKKVRHYLYNEKRVGGKPSFIPLCFLDSLLSSIPNTMEELSVVKEISKSIRIFDLGTLGYYLYSCNDIIEAIKSYACFAMLVSDFIHYDVDTEGNKLAWQASYGNAEKMMSARSYRLFYELEISIRHSLVCKLLGDDINCMVRKTKLVYHFENDHLLLVSANARINMELEKILVHSLMKKEGFIELVKIFIKKNLSSKKLSIEKLAVFLNISNRSVQRYLKKENTSYKALLLEVRKELVGDYLRQKLPMKKVACRLGYRDVGSFFRAFKSWYGCSTQKFLEAA